jgi:hypothetical protein
MRPSLNHETKAIGAIRCPGGTWLWLAIILVGLVFISPDSFWIDEGNTAYKASQPTLSAWFKALFVVTGSDAQMPGYMLYTWIWQKLAGNSEFALRLSNMPWLVLLVLAVRRFPWAVAVVLTSPFILNYLNELRPYLMQIAGAALAVNGISRLKDDTPAGWTTTLAGCLVMSASSLLGVIWSLGAMVHVIVESPNRLKCRWFWMRNFAYFPGFAFLGLYYAWTLAQGQGAALMGGSFLISLAAAGYELLGLAGLGPGKIDLRINPESSAGYLWILAPATLISAGLLFWSSADWFRHASKKQVVPAICGVATPVILIFSLVLLKDFRVLGRHLAPLSVLIVLLVAHAASSPRLPRRLAVLVIGLAIASSLSLRFSTRHRKDDYRAAAAIAKEAIEHQRPVIWVADEWTAYFYGLDKNHTGWQPWRDNKPLPTLAGGETVLLTKPDIYDSKGGMQALLTERGFTPVRQLQAFTVFERNKELSGNQ